VFTSPPLRVGAVTVLVVINLAPNITRSARHYKCYRAGVKVQALNKAARTSEP